MAERGSDYGYLSIERWLEASIIERKEVPPGAFRPQPRVWSTVLVLERRPDPVPQPGKTALLLDESRCIRCALCIDRCPTRALSMGMWSGVGVPKPEPVPVLVGGMS